MVYRFQVCKNIVIALCCEIKDVELPHYTEMQKQYTLEFEKNEKILVENTFN